MPRARVPQHTATRGGYTHAPILRSALHAVGTSARQLRLADHATGQRLRDLAALRSECRILPQLGCYPALRVRPLRYAIAELPERRQESL